MNITRLKQGNGLQCHNWTMLDAMQLFLSQTTSCTLSKVILEQDSPMKKKKLSLSLNVILSKDTIWIQTRKSNQSGRFSKYKLQNISIEVLFPFFLCNKISVMPSSETKIRFWYLVDTEICKGSIEVTCRKNQSR